MGNKEKSPEVRIMLPDGMEAVMKHLEGDPTYRKTQAELYKAMAAFYEGSSTGKAAGRPKDQWVTDGVHERFSQDRHTPWPKVYRVPAVAAEIRRGMREENRTLPQMQDRVRRAINMRHRRETKGKNNAI